VGIAVGKTGVGVTVGGTGVDVGIGGTVPHATKSSKTNVKPIKCDSTLL
jgi:hypothetical protein